MIHFLTTISAFSANDNRNSNNMVIFAPSNQYIMSTQSMIQTIAKYFETQPVLKAWLFGSFARGEEKPWSDVDILFVPDYSGKPFTLLTMGGMYLDLRELLGREVDLVVDGSLRPYAVESAERDKQLIYERKSEG
jgi:predicted nucleotidyltransferase